MKYTMMKKTGARTSFFTAVIMTIVFFTACSNKDELSVGPEGDQVKLVVQVAGIAESKSFVASKVKATTARYGNENNAVKQHLKFNEFKGVVSSTEEAISEAQQVLLDKIGTSSNLNVANSGIGANMMANDIKYRLLLYTNDGGSFVTSVEATAGQRIEIDVALGEQYQWYAYSYNTTETIADLTDTATPNVETPIDKDLLYASGDIAVNGQSTPLAITFAHKLAQVLVEINTEQLGGDISVTLPKIRTV